MLLNTATFTISAFELDQLPQDSICEVAFVGRSNVGKSSVINTLTNQKNLAKSSKTPGRTQAINYFAITPSHYLVDLPGYGYAKVSQSIKKKWQKLLPQYFTSRNSLQGVILIMDIRHPLTDFDRQMLEFTKSCNLTVHILLNKADKLSKNQANSTLSSVRAQLKKISDKLSIQLFSSTTRLGAADARNMVTSWLQQT